MSLPNYLAKIKSSGIYRFVWDKSEIAGVPAEVLRLVVGYSEKGPFNTPVYIQSDTEFKAIFGDISKKLEKRGIFFHRMALQCLSKGPIIALNLKKFENEAVDACSFNVSDASITPGDIRVESIYDTTRFWKLDPEAILPATAGSDTANKTKYISITSADSKETSCSIFIRGFKPSGYDVTVKNWYSSQNEELPDYFVNADGDFSSLLVSDFWAEIYVFRGEFTPALCASEPLNKYFDVIGGKPQLKEYIVNGFGEKVDTLAALAADDASNFVNNYNGCLLPYFKSQTGSYVSLDLAFNSDNGLHKMMMNLNSDLLYNGDIKIASLVTTGWTNTSAFGAPLKQTTEVYAGTVTETYDPSKKILLNKKYEYTYAPKEGAEPTAYDPDFIEYKGGVAEEGETDDLVKYIGGIGYKFVAEKEVSIGDVALKALVYDPEGGNKYMNANHVAISNGKTYIDSGNEKYVLSNLELVDLITLPVTLSDKTTYYRYEGTEEGILNDASATFKVYHAVSESPIETDIYVNNSKVYKKTGEGDEAVYTEVTGAVPADEIAGETGAFDFKSAGFLVGERVIYKNLFYTITDVTTDFLKLNDVNGVEVVVSRKDTVKKCNHSASITNYQLKPFYFEGYVYEHDKPKNEGMKDWDKLKWHKFILSTLFYYDGLRIGLTSRTDIDYRYIVDTFEGLVDNEEHKELALICKQKDNSVGFLNFPSMKTFKNCEYSSFVDNNGKLQVKYIAEGANKKKQPAVLFSLVSDLNGGSYVSYNTPVVFSDGTVKTTVPSAALVSNNFMEKYESRQPYYIVAGPTYGRMLYPGLVGPEFNFTRADLDILEPMGVNCMVYVPRLGTYINSNQTAKQNPVTALSKLHVRELVIYLQDEIEKLLQDYQWEFNTPYLRDLVKAKADTICEKVKNNGGLYEYLNVCDESNNTDDVINNEMFVLSTSIEPGMGCGKMVQELTIYKKGQMSSIIK